MLNLNPTTYVRINFVCCIIINYEWTRIVIIPGYPCINQTAGLEWGKKLKLWTWTHLTLKSCYFCRGREETKGKEENLNNFYGFASINCIHNSSIQKGANKHEENAVLLQGSFMHFKDELWERRHGTLLYFVSFYTKDARRKAPLKWSSQANSYKYFYSSYTHWAITRTIKHS